MGTGVVAEPPFVLPRSFDVGFVSAISTVGVASPAGASCWLTRRCRDDERERGQSAYAHGGLRDGRFDGCSSRRRA